MDCTRYYLCSQSGSKIQANTCANGFVYNSMAQQCKKKVWSSDCIVINCTPYKNKYVVYTGDKSFYAFCAFTNNIYTPTMYKCPNVGEEFNQNIQQCQRKCTKAGRQSDPTDCQRYYECLRVGTSFISQRKTCANGYKYNAAVNNCVLGKCSIILPTTVIPTPTTKTTMQKPTTTKSSAISTNVTICTSAGYFPSK